MTVAGDLADLDPGDLIQALSVLGKSGRLRLERVDQEGLIVFRNGKIIFVASSSVRESLGSLLVKKNLISQRELLEAIERQSDRAEEVRLGGVLIEMGLLSAEVVDEVIREQFSRIVSEFIAWTSGKFRFDKLEVIDHGEVEVDATELVAPSGLEPTHVLLEAARQADEETAPEFAAESLSSMLGEIESPTIGGETVYRLLDVASEICGRCILFSVRQSEFEAIGHLAVDPADSRSAKELASLVVPRAAPSILASAIDRKTPILAMLPDGEWDQWILDALGGPPLGKSVTIPVAMGDELSLVLYGDRLEENLSTGFLEELEAAINRELAAA